MSADQQYQQYNMVDANDGEAAGDPYLSDFDRDSWQGDGKNFEGGQPETPLSLEAE